MTNQSYFDLLDFLEEYYDNESFDYEDDVDYIKLDDEDFELLDQESFYNYFNQN